MTAVVTLDWRHRAACRGLDDLFFPDAEPGTLAHTVQQSAAQAVCRLCPVRRQCQDYAVAKGERHGIWGAMNEGAPYDVRRLRIRRATAAARRTAA